MRKVALISPKGSLFGRNEKMKSFVENSKIMESFRYLWSGPNLGLITIAAYMPKEWDIEYIDENYVEIDYTKKYDIVCLSAMTQQAPNAYRIAKKFRDKGTLTVMGGIHATVSPEEAAKNVDVVIVGEGEVLWPRFLRDYLSGDIKRIYKESKQGEYDLKKALIPRYDLLVGYEYPVITLYTTRGCPHDCSFCCASNIYGHKYRRKSNTQIVKELELINSLFPDRLILFADDNMLVKRRECKEMLKAMVDMNLRWIAQTDISIAQDEELLELMVLAGCQWVVIGFESISHRSLRDIEKIYFKLKHQSQYPELIKKIQSYGIGIYGTFIVGLDNDTINVFEFTTDFILQNNLYGVNITVPTPLPGTQLREKLVNEGRVLNGDWGYYTLWDVVIRPRKMSVKQLQDGLLYMYKRINEDFASKERLVYLREAVKIRKKICESYKKREGCEENE
ncbi:B12-binding domain-containing radical SAM protein [Wukongibacter sp. M2B1]|uniref:B12-binding domain-containing radical SAM protein n=1 Tax=Wukongibacter sp. M2B1 TaxID=3088895 RepID=UPI003D7AD638